MRFGRTESLPNPPKWDSAKSKYFANYFKGSDEPSIFVEPSIPDEAIPQAQQSRLQRLLRQFIHFDSERRQEVQGQRPETVTQSGTSRTVQSSTEDCYVKKVVLTLNGVWHCFEKFTTWVKISIIYRFNRYKEICLPFGIITYDIKIFRELSSSVELDNVVHFIRKTSFKIFEILFLHFLVVLLKIPFSIIDIL